MWQTRHARHASERASGELGADADLGKETEKTAVLDERDGGHQKLDGRSDAPRKLDLGELVEGRRGLFAPEPRHDEGEPPDLLTAEARPSVERVTATTSENAGR